jgi:outer membrane lipoprotein-sorting protein
VLVVVAGLVSLPAVISRLPAPGSSANAVNTANTSALLARINASASVGYSGYAESTGGIALPVTTSQFTSIANLFGDTTQLRVWWRSKTDWRVDTVAFTGENDVHQIGDQVWTFDYESNRATLTNQPTPPTVRLPVAADVLPPQLADRLLSEAQPSQVTSLPDLRVAGRGADGLRLTPSDPQSTIGHVDVWADAKTAIPLRVAVYGTGSGAAILTTSFLDFSASRPAAGDIAFTPAAGVKVNTGGNLDVAALISRFGRTQPPAQLAGIGRNDELPQVGAIGVYGRGVTEFAAVPLFGNTVASLRKQLAAAPGVTSNSSGLTASIGGLSLLLTDPPGGQRTWLLTGTVTSTLLARAAAELPVELRR